MVYKSRSFSPQNPCIHGRSQTLVDFMRPSLRSQARIKIPQTPLNSPDTGIKVVRVTSKSREPRTEKEVKSDEDSPKVFQPPLKVSISEDSSKNPNLEQQSDSTLRSTDAKQSSNSLISPRRIFKKPDNNSTFINLSRQLLDMRKKADRSFTKTDCMKIKSFHKKSETKTKRSLLRNYPKTSQRSSSHIDELYSPLDHTRANERIHERSKAENPFLQIGHSATTLGKASPTWHDASLRFSPRVSIVFAAQVTLEQGKLLICNRGLTRGSGGRARKPNANSSLGAESPDAGDFRYCCTT